VREAPAEPGYEYGFVNFFHPFVGELIERLNRTSLPGLLDAAFHSSLREDHNPAIEREDAADFLYRNFAYERPEDSRFVRVNGSPREIDLEGGPYAIYNWELLFHVPLTVAVHLSKNQRFAEAQRWFHYVFDPTCNDASVPRPQRYWKFLRFRQPDAATHVDELVRNLSIPDRELTGAERAWRESALRQLNAIRDTPFQPHAIAGLRHVAYQYSVVMKYLDNLIAWGDSLFRQDTIESINEATQIYVLAANILGERPQRTPHTGAVRTMSYHRLKENLGPIGNAIVNLEHQFPFNGSLPALPASDSGAAETVFGMGRTLYFCVPSNEKLLAYWGTVADRLLKIRHCMNIEGVTRQLALFDPPLDPGMLVKATAAGIDVGSIVAGLNQPVGPTRSLVLIQKALELCGELRNLGAALLAAIERGDGEHLALLRQGHEIKIQGMAREVRFLQWRQAQESTEALLRSRAGTLERYRYYLRLLGEAPDTGVAPDALAPDRRELTEDNFDETYAALVGQFDRTVPVSEYPALETKEEGRLHLHKGEHDELNEHADRALAARISGTGAETIAAALSAIPTFYVKAAYWGLGADAKVGGGDVFSSIGRAVSSGFGIWAQVEEWQGIRASKTASYERRADDWMLQANLAARELTQIGRQIIGSLIAEQIAFRDSQNVTAQAEQAEEVDRLLRDKFTNEELYSWMQGELTRLYYEHYRFALDAARRAERTMKHELMRPEVDATEFVRFNYWDGGRKGLLSGETLLLDVKRLEAAYHDNNRREFELTKHISLRQLNPLALLTLRATGTCEVTVPEWLCDLDCPGHYMRRIKQVSVSLPSVTGPLTSVNCTVTLLRSSLRKSASLEGGYARRAGEDDPRFVDYFGAIESIVTSGGTEDGGMFETSLRDERFLPFEGAGLISAWRFGLPMEFRQFDYETISDLILHIRYTSREGGELKTAATRQLQAMLSDDGTSELVVLLSLRHDFPNEWNRFATASVESATPFSATVSPRYFPYLAQGRRITVTDVVLCRLQGAGPVVTRTIVPSPLGVIGPAGSRLEVPRSELTDGAGEVSRSAEYFAVLKYTVSPTRLGDG
jgi:hypothetical protein